MSHLAAMMDTTSLMTHSNPFLSLWLSGANAWAGAMRGLWMAEFQRQQTAMMQEATRQATRFWSSALMAPMAALPRPAAPTRPDPAPAPAEAAAASANIAPESVPTQEPTERAARASGSGRALAATSARRRAPQPSAGKPRRATSKKSQGSSTKPRRTRR